MKLTEWMKERKPEKFVSLDAVIWSQFSKLGVIPPALQRSSRKLISGIISE